MENIMIVFLSVIFSLKKRELVPSDIPKPPNLAVAIAVEGGTPSNTIRGVVIRPPPPPDAPLSMELRNVTIPTITKSLIFEPLFC